MGKSWARNAAQILVPTDSTSHGPRQANLLLIAYASSEGSGEPAHPRSLARTSAARSYKQWVKRNLQTESQIHSPSEWLGMRSWNLSWRNARRHKFAWRGSNGSGYLVGATFHGAHMKCMICSQIFAYLRSLDYFQGWIPFKQKLQVNRKAVLFCGNSYKIYLDPTWPNILWVYFLQFLINSRWQGIKMALPPHPLCQTSLYVSRHWLLDRILEVEISLARWAVNMRWPSTECQIHTTEWIVWIWF